jgi:hypothetical protein
MAIPLVFFRVFGVFRGLNAPPYFAAPLRCALFG